MGNIINKIIAFSLIILLLPVFIIISIIILIDDGYPVLYIQKNYGEDHKIIEADNEDDATEMAYEEWREAAENSADYDAQLYTEKVAKELHLE